VGVELLLIANKMGSVFRHKNAGWSFSMLSQCASAAGAGRTCDGAVLSPIALKVTSGSDTASYATSIANITVTT
jgi:hypothetical protein